MARQARLFVLLTWLAQSCGQPGVIDPGVYDEDTGAPGSVCQPGLRFCNGKTLWQCKTDGSGYNLIQCESGCENDACKSHSCTPNTHRCIGPKLADHCDAAGVSHPIACDHGCLDGECVDIVCDAGKTFCNEGRTQVQQCSFDGLTITDLEYCPYGCEPASAACKAAACAPGQVRCSPVDPDAVEQCNAARTAWEQSGVVCEEKCVDGKCWVSACKPGSRRCGPSMLEECKADGTGFADKEECKWGCLDNGAGQAMCAQCLPGAYACKGDTVVYCEEPQLPWQELKDCKEIDSCVGGTCVEVLVLDDSQTVKERHLLLARALAACWLVKKGETKEKDLCRSIDASGLSVAVAKGELMGWFCDGEGDTIEAQDFESTEAFEAAKDLMGCGILNPANLTFKTDGEKVNPGLEMVECIAYEKDVLVEPCAMVQKSSK